MIPMKTSNIFRNRWWAILWSAGILWVAYDVADTGGGGDGNNNIATDVTGAPVTPADEQALAQAINSI